jgi:hypothetical protein
MTIKMIRTSAPPTSDRIWGLDPLLGLPYGTVVIDLAGQSWRIVSAGLRRG